MKKIGWAELRKIGKRGKWYFYGTWLQKKKPKECVGVFEFHKFIPIYADEKDLR